jgi:uncharacterized protein (DUF885 family)
MEQTHAELASCYFATLASRFPVMCASDEFVFLPRAQAAALHYDQIEDLDADAIGQWLADLKAVHRDLARRAASAADLEARIDLELLQANAAGLLIEFEEIQSWRHNPLLYLKIAFIGLDHALTKPASHPREQTARATARLQAIPRLLQQARANIDSTPAAYHQAAIAMLGDCRRYLNEVGGQVADLEAQPFTRALQRVGSALEVFGSFLTGLAPLADERFEVPGMERNLREHLLCTRSLPEIFQIAVEEWRVGLEQMHKLRASIDPRKSWEQLYHTYHPAEVEELDTFALYGREIERLRNFFGAHGFGELARSSPVVLCETPTYLRSVRSSASFSAASGAHAGEADRFYLTTRLPRHRGKQAEAHLRNRLHREYRFLSAHETFPGHQLLDGIRRNLQNPVRRQIESPLFYEGWAYYAESLLAEYGYVDRPIELLVDCKRRLWRAARCQIDVGTATGALEPGAAVQLLTAAGFSREEAATQVQRFRLNPGYQLCYSLGRYEIMELRKTFAPALGREQFHQQLLEGGQLPFHLAAKRLRSLDPSKPK